MPGKLTIRKRFEFSPGLVGQAGHGKTRVPYTPLYGGGCTEGTYPLRGQDTSTLNLPGTAGRCFSLLDAGYVLNYGRPALRAGIRLAPTRWTRLWRRPGLVLHAPRSNQDGCPRAALRGAGRCPPRINRPVGGPISAGAEIWCAAPPRASP